MAPCRSEERGLTVPISSASGRSSTRSGSPCPGARPGDIDVGERRRTARAEVFFTAPPQAWCRDRGKAVVVLDLDTVLFTHRKSRHRHNPSPRLAEPPSLMPQDP